MKEHPLLLRLHGGKSMSVGEAALVAQEVLLNQELVAVLFSGLTHEVPVVRMRSAYSLAKVGKARPEWLMPFKEPFLDVFAGESPGHIARACLLEMLPAFVLTADEKDLVVDVLCGFMQSDSSIVKTFSLQRLVEYAEADPALRDTVMPLLWNARDNGTPAMRARARKLMKKYGM